MSNSNKRVFQSLSGSASNNIEKKNKSFLVLQKANLIPEIDFYK